MILIITIILFPAIILLVRIYLIINKSIWNETNGEIIDFDIVKKGRGAISEFFDDAPNNYILVKYSYRVENKIYYSNRISLSLVDRGYRPVEIDHDKFISKLKMKNLSVYYCKKIPKISVIDNSIQNISSNIALLLIYLSVVLSSYLIIIFIS